MMNKIWSELNKTMQAQIIKKDTYEAGIVTLFNLRNQLIEILYLIFDYPHKHYTFKYFEV